MNAEIDPVKHGLGLAAERSESGRIALPPPLPPPLPSARWLGRATPALAGLVRRTGRLVDWLMGLLTLIVTLAVLAVIPVLNLLSLGYLLEASARVARSRRLRDGFIGVRVASVFGRTVVASWLLLWPARFVLGLSRDAEWIEPGGRAAHLWQGVFLIVTTLSLAHIVGACVRGAKLRHFLWPAPRRFRAWLSTPDKLSRAGESALRYLIGLRLGHYFKLGLMGLIGGLVWLAVPVGLLIVGAFLPPPGAVLLGLLGGAGLVWVAMYLPFAQTHCAIENRFGALFELGRVRALFDRAPLAFGAALCGLLLFSVPLYLLKIEFPPREIAWLPSLIFVLFIFPARLLTGWAMGRAQGREGSCHFTARGLGRLGAVGVAGLYALVVCLTPYLSWHGVLSLIEQHAFLVPAPMLSL